MQSAVIGNVKLSANRKRARLDLLVAPNDPAEEIRTNVGAVAVAGSSKKSDVDMKDLMQMVLQNGNVHPDRHPFTHSALVLIVSNVRATLKYRGVYEKWNEEATRMVLEAVAKPKKKRRSAAAEYRAIEDSLPESGAQNVGFPKKCNVVAAALDVPEGNIPESIGVPEGIVPESGAQSAGSPTKSNDVAATLDVPGEPGVATSSARPRRRKRARSKSSSSSSSSSSATVTDWKAAAMEWKAKCSTLEEKVGRLEEDLATERAHWEKLFDDFSELQGRVEYFESLPTTGRADV